MAVNPYQNIVPNTTTGSNAATGLNGVGADTNIAVKTVSSFANIASEVYYYTLNTRVLTLDTNRYYKYNGSAWVADTLLSFTQSSTTEANMIALDVANDILYLGGTTNGVKIGKGGEFSLIGTATKFDDLRVEITARNTGQKAPTLSLWINGLYLYDFDNAAVASEKEVFFAIQLPHSWKEGSTIYPHAHWTPKTSGSAGQVVRWGLEYTIAKPSGQFGASTIIYGETIGVGDITQSDNHIITPIGAGIVMTGMTLSSVIVGRLFRNSSHANDTYTGIAGGLSFDIHYEVDSLGSSSEYTK